MRHDAALNLKDKDGSTRRAHLEKAAERGSASALAALEGPEVPEPLAYLRDWAHELIGRSGVGMDGLAPLSYGTIAEWARLTGRDPTPWEVEALLVVDAVIRHPEV